MSTPIFYGDGDSTSGHQHITREHCKATKRRLIRIPALAQINPAVHTTTSMGRLTLNVLLSFAQFEREVTGERIRDKIAASKREGMWMGGLVPLGYDVCEGKSAPLIGRSVGPRPCGEHLSGLDAKIPAKSAGFVQFEGRIAKHQGLPAG
jgi:hypothetical protein